MILERRIVSFVIGFICMFCIACGVSARVQNTWIEGPVDAQVLRVLDGDTVEVLAFPWPQQSITVKVRLRGIDAPEIHSRCRDEKARGFAARLKLSEMLDQQPDIRLVNISGGKYFGRILADLKLQDGQDASSIMLQAGLVRPYHGGTRKKAACP